MSTVKYILILQLDGKSSQGMYYTLYSFVTQSFVTQISTLTSSVVSPVDYRRLSWDFSAPFSPWSHQNLTLQNQRSPIPPSEWPEKTWVVHAQASERSMQKILGAKCQLGCHLSILAPSQGSVTMTQPWPCLPFYFPWWLPGDTGACSVNSFHYICSPCHRGSVYHMLYPSIHEANFHHWQLSATD